ncbi:hypothetical protein SAMN05216188_107183 [Lentzea xinjiangensis]|uniref:DUF4034 domain-containing protein n=1 Tax=Lentzea xinjiangensis TaxID=402600 RepID=A0A1H9L099_9PSEU|nr:hypothetical protein [Lentzea xinjiangensis]SER04453.1 hypothetical protein SAMN05216188_107183 [Lentzea xinjiangensis]
MPSKLPGDVDLAFDDDELLHALHALADGDLTPALGFLTATRDQPYRRELALDAFAYAGSPVLPHLLAATEADPDNVQLLLLLGSAQVAVGWQARGARYADHTTDEQWAGLRDSTQQARRTLLRAAELDPDDVAPWAMLMAVALGAPLATREPADIYEEVHKRVPDLVNATLRRLQSTAKKWYGSEEEMFAFARTGIADLPDGHPLLAMIAVAHIEKHLENYRTGGNKLKRLWRALTYLGKQRDEVNAASDRLLAGADDHPHSRWGHQIFATYYLEADKEQDRDRFAQHMRRSGPLPMRWPWSYFGNHEKQFAKARAASGLTN